MRHQKADAIKAERSSSSSSCNSSSSFKPDEVKVEGKKNKRGRPKKRIHHFSKKARKEEPKQEPEDPRTSMRDCVVRVKTIPDSQVDNYNIQTNKSSSPPTAAEIDYDLGAALDAGTMSPAEVMNRLEAIISRHSSESPKTPEEMEQDLIAALDAGTMTDDQVMHQLEAIIQQNSPPAELQISDALEAFQRAEQEMFRPNLPAATLPTTQPVPTSPPIPTSPKVSTSPTSPPVSRKPCLVFDEFQLLPHELMHHLTQLEDVAWTVGSWEYWLSGYHFFITTQGIMERLRAASGSYNEYYRVLTECLVEVIEYLGDSERMEQDEDQYAAYVNTPEFMRRLPFTMFVTGDSGYCYFVYETLPLEDRMPYEVPQDEEEDQQPVAPFSPVAPGPSVAPLSSQILPDLVFDKLLNHPDPIFQNLREIELSALKQGIWEYFATAYFFYITTEGCFYKLLNCHSYEEIDKTVKEYVVDMCDYFTHANRMEADGERYSDYMGVSMEKLKLFAMTKMINGEIDNSFFFKRKRSGKSRSPSDEEVQEPQSIQPPTQPTTQPTTQPPLKQNQFVTANDLQKALKVVLPAEKKKPMTGAERQRKYREKKKEEERARNTERRRIKRSQLSDSQRSAIREKDADQHWSQRTQMSPSRAAVVHQRHQQEQQRYLSQLTPSERSLIAQQDAEQHQSQRLRISQSMPELADEIQAANTAAHYTAYHRQKEKVREDLRKLFEDFNCYPIDPHKPRRYNEAVVPEHSVGAFNVECKYCKALHFAGEANRNGLFNKCCNLGKIKLEKPNHPYPAFLKAWFTDETNRDYETMHENCLHINSLVSFAAINANIASIPGVDNMPLTINGAVYHILKERTIPGYRDGRLYGQWYCMDSLTQAVYVQRQNPVTRRIPIYMIRETMEHIKAVNPYCQTMLMMEEKFQEMRDNGQDTHNLCAVFNKAATIPGVHPGRQNLPVADEVGVVISLDNDGVLPFERAMKVYHKPGHENADPPFIHPDNSMNVSLAFALAFPDGYSGWHHNLVVKGWGPYNNTNKKVSLLQWYAYLAQERKENPYGPLLQMGKLSQQLFINGFADIESERLNFLQLNQERLQAEKYDIQNRFNRKAQAQGHEKGVVVVLPSTHQQSTRCMKENCADAMAIFNHHKTMPHLFITFTANPKWKEIVDALNQVGQTCDPRQRPDIICRVFKLKLDHFVETVCKNGLLGPALCWVYTIEFQKRGLPHAHMLLALENPLAPNTIEMVDRLCSGELPDPEECPNLHIKVSRFLHHGPCAPNLCQDGQGRCKKRFPKPETQETYSVPMDYPALMRRTQHDPRNIWIVPYTPILITMYNAHINTMVTAFMRANIKYPFKYTYKGFDTATIEIRDGTAVYNEIKAYISGRYLSACESFWRIYQFEMGKMSHSVVRLRLHLENSTEIFIEVEDALNDGTEARPKQTQLEAYFKFQLENIDVPHLLCLYRQIPEIAVWKNNCWQERKAGFGKTIGRVAMINPNNRELFAIRVILSAYPGITSTLR